MGSLVKPPFMPDRIALVGTARALLSLNVHPSFEPGLAAMLRKIRKRKILKGKGFFQ